jgi:hypothetical protein
MALVNRRLFLKSAAGAAIAGSAAYIAIEEGVSPEERQSLIDEFQRAFPGESREEAALAIDGEMNSLRVKGTAVVISGLAGACLGPMIFRNYSPN